MVNTRENTALLDGILASVAFIRLAGFANSKPHALIAFPITPHYIARLFRNVGAKIVRLLPSPY